MSYKKLGEGYTKIINIKYIYILIRKEGINQKENVKGL